MYIVNRMNINQDLDYNVVQAKRESSPRTCDEGAPISGTLINNGKSNSRYTYLLTIKCHARVHVPKAYLDELLLQTRRKINSSKLKADWSSLVAYEEDSIGRMHIHTFFITQKPIFMEKYQIPGWSVHFQSRKDGKLLDGKSALSYMSKLPQGIHAVNQRFDVNWYRFISRFA